MSAIHVQVSITSLDSNISFDVDGEYKNNRIIFDDLESNTHYIILSEHKIDYYKKGSVDMKYSFHLDQMTKGYYSVQNNKFEFDIVTNTILLQENQLDISYDLYQGSELVNKTDIHVKYQYKEES
jgi:uncharacterized beta-barrel protein YwiB (DUF1934 family)